MWKYKVEQKYKIEALAKSDIEYVIEKYTDKAVMDKERIFFMGQNFLAQMMSKEMQVGICLHLGSLIVKNF